jgi:3-hydroxyisobutyrate dehydrogenase-like beta-hydroxyacid dehydrogenase
MLVVTAMDFSREMPAKIGFIGLGYMGSRIAKRFLDAGHTLIVFNRNRSKTEALAAEGAEVAASPGELASSTDLILSCLSDGTAVRNVYLGAGGVLDCARPGSVVLEMSTIAPETSEQLHRAGRERGIHLLDIAISGSTVAAEAGSLTLFGGGEHEVFKAIAPLFCAIARQWFYMGPAGSGVAMKLVVNTLLGVGMQAIAEALALGSGLGLERGLLFDTLAKTAVVAPAHVGKFAAAKMSDYRPQFPMRLMHKDFLLISSKAARLGIAMPVTVEATRINAAEMASHGGEEDFSAVIRAMEQMTDMRTDTGRPVDRALMSYSR